METAGLNLREIEIRKRIAEQDCWNTEIAAFQATQIPGLTSTQIDALSTSQVSVLSSTQVNALNTTDLQYLATTQVQALSSTVISYLLTLQVQSFLDTQIAALERIYSDVVSNGKRFYPGYPVGSEGGWNRQMPSANNAGIWSTYAESFLQYEAYPEKDSKLTLDKFDINKDPQRAKLSGEILDATDTDLSAFPPACRQETPCLPCSNDFSPCSSA